jgi:Ca2+-binding EF-hand superfamily protein
MRSICLGDAYNGFSLSFLDYLHNKTDMDAQSLELIKSTFDEIDKDSNGSIDVAELKEKLQNHIDSGLLKSDAVDEIFNTLDKNSDGKIVFEEFIAGIQAFKNFLK